MLSEFSGKKSFSDKININMINFYKHEMKTSCKYFLCETFGEIFVK
jgi:hypothetical protein